MKPYRNRRQVMAGGLALAAGAVLSSRSRAALIWANTKTLVVYYSRTGHTRTVAEMIQRQTGGDLVAIETLKAYPQDYDTLVAQNVAEQRSGYLPPLRTRIDDIASYDIVFVGSPLWNVRLTPPVRSFLASHDLAGRTVAPFVTYIVSGLGHARQDIAELAPHACVMEGLAVLGADATLAEGKVADWLATLTNRQDISR